MPAFRPTPHQLLWTSRQHCKSPTPEPGVSDAHVSAWEACLARWLALLLGRRRGIEHDVTFDADLLDQIELALEEIDVLLFAPQYSQQQITGDEIAHTLAICDAFAQIPQRLFLQGQVGLQDLLYILTDADRVEPL